MITIESKILDKHASNALEALSKLFGHIMHCLFVDLYIRKLSLNEVKKCYLKKFAISSRHFNGLRYEIDARVKSQRELIKLNIANKKNQIKAVDKKIKSLASKKEKLMRAQKAIQNYKRATAKWREEGRVKTKPKLVKSLAKQHYILHAVSAEITKLSFMIHHKKSDVVISC